MRDRASGLDLLLPNGKTERVTKRVGDSMTAQARVGFRDGPHPER